MLLLLLLGPLQSAGQLVAGLHVEVHLTRVRRLLPGTVGLVDQAGVNLRVADDLKGLLVDSHVPPPTPTPR